MKTVYINTTLVCDGCGRNDSYECQDVPDGWESVIVDGEESDDICPECFAKYFHPDLQQWWMTEHAYGEVDGGYTCLFRMWRLDELARSYYRASLEFEGVPSTNYHLVADGQNESLDWVLICVQAPDEQNALILARTYAETRIDFPLEFESGTFDTNEDRENAD